MPKELLTRRMSSVVCVIKPFFRIQSLTISLMTPKDRKFTSFSILLLQSLDNLFYNSYITMFRRCMGNCGVEDKSLITHFCINCEDYLCGSCVNVHQNGHKIKESKAYIPMISRCVNQEHEVRLANHVCHCGAVSSSFYSRAFQKSFCV